MRRCVDVVLYRTAMQSCCRLSRCRAVYNTRQGNRVYRVAENNNSRCSRCYRCVKADHWYTKILVSSSSSCSCFGVFFLKKLKRKGEKKAILTYPVLRRQAGIKIFNTHQSAYSTAEDGVST